MEVIPHSWNLFRIAGLRHERDNPLHTLVPVPIDGCIHLMLHSGRGQCLWGEDQYQPFASAQCFTDTCHKVAMLHIDHINPNLDPRVAQVSHESGGELIVLMTVADKYPGPGALGGRR